MTKASEGDADVVILDLEDSVSESQKVSARGMVTEFLKARSKEVKPRLYVRVNPLDTGYCLSDIADVVTGGPAGILLPKCNSGSDIQKLSSYLDVLEVANGLIKDSIKIIAVATETAASVFNMGSYENCSARLNGITWGAEDLGAAVRASTSLTSTKDWTSPYQMVRSLCLLELMLPTLRHWIRLWLIFEILHNLQLFVTKQGKTALRASWQFIPAR